MPEQQSEIAFIERTFQISTKSLMDAYGNLKPRIYVWDVDFSKMPPEMRIGTLQGRQP